MCVAKTKALISCSVTAQLICGFDFAYAKSRFSHDAAHIKVGFEGESKLHGRISIMNLSEYHQGLRK